MWPSVSSQISEMHLHTARHHPLLEHLDIQPIVQAPMAGVSTPALAAAVSNAGGLGSIAIGASDVATARRMIEQTRALTARPFNVNVFAHAPAVRDAAREAAWIERLRPLFEAFGTEPPEALDEIYPSFLADETVLSLLLDTRPAVVSFHFGVPPRSWVDRLRDAGILTFATATSTGEADRIAGAGIDAIVAQGIEAGGHRGMFDPHAPDAQLGTAALVRLLRAHSQLPVIAAGGIMDGQGIRAALDLGACAAQLGTAFVLCPESAAGPEYRAALASECSRTTRLTRVLSGRPARGLVNRLMARFDASDSAAAPDYPVAYDAAKQLHAAAARHGVSDFAAQWAGQGAPLARALPAADLVAVLLEEMRGAP